MRLLQNGYGADPMVITDLPPIQGQVPPKESSFLGLSTIEWIVYGAAGYVIYKAIRNH